MCVTSRGKPVITGAPYPYLSLPTALLNLGMSWFEDAMLDLHHLEKRCPGESSNTQLTLCDKEMKLCCVLSLKILGWLLSHYNLTDPESYCPS